MFLIFFRWNVTKNPAGISPGSWGLPSVRADSYRDSQFLPIIQQKGTYPTWGEPESFLPGLCRWLLESPWPLWSMVWPIINPISVTFGQTTSQPHIPFFTPILPEFSYPRNPENLRHNSSNYWKCNSHENTIPFSGTSLLSYYWELPSPKTFTKGEIADNLQGAFVPFLTFLSGLTQLGSPL